MHQGHRGKRRGRLRGKQQPGRTGFRRSPIGHRIVQRAGDAFAVAASHSPLSVTKTASRV